MFNLYKFEQKLKEQKEFEEAASAEAQAKFEKKMSKCSCKLVIKHRTKRRHVKEVQG